MDAKILIGLLLIVTFNSFSQEYFDVIKDFPCNDCGESYSPNANLQGLKVYDYKLIESVFDSITNASAIEFNYPQGGCQQRAQIMSMFLKNKYKIEHARIWLFAPVNLIESNETELEIDDPNKLASNGKIKWGYHVAPVILGKSKSRIDTLVIDPSINRDKPILVREWFDKIRNSNKSKYTFLKDSKYFFNVQCCNPDGSLKRIINGYFYDFSGFAKNNLTLEKGLALNDVAIYVFEKYIKDKENDSITKGLKTIFGNATTLDYFLTNASICATFGCKTPYKPLMTERELIKTYGDTLIDARTYYYNRILYWTLITEKYSNN